jgi:hypothetical protein
MEDASLKLVISLARQTPSNIIAIETEVQKSLGNEIRWRERQQRD